MKPYKSVAEKTDQRARGAFFTPPSLTVLMAEWGLFREDMTVLEPSFGDGEFIQALRQVSLSKRLNLAAVVGVELDPKRHVTTSLFESDRWPDRAVHNDFLRTPVLDHVDLVIGNPPFVRLRHLDDEQRAAAHIAGSEGFGSRLDSSGSVWLPFVTRASQWLKDGGRLALVLPVEMTHVKYARAVWEFLGSRFGKVTVKRVQERLFSDLMQDVVLLFAEDFGRSSKSIQFEAFNTFKDLRAESPCSVSTISVTEAGCEGRPFVRALLPPETRDLLQEVLEPNTSRTFDFIKFNIGYVSGDKSFFHPTTRDIATFGIPSSSLRPTLAAGRQLQTSGLFTSQLSAEYASQLFLPNAQALTEGDRKYISAGLAGGVAERYKCKVRSPWYLVPGTRAADVLVSVFSERPKLVVNDGRLQASNSLIAGYLRGGVSPTQFAASWYTPLTLLSVELSVHSLGGGVLVLVPNEADSIRVVRPGQLNEGHLPVVDECLATHRVADAYAQGSGLIRQALKLSTNDLDLINQGREILAGWRSRAPLGRDL